MTAPKIGELFAGYGGLGMGVKAALGGEVAWVSDIDKGANKVLAHRFPDVPNLGDITGIDWADVEPVDVLTGGFPCQDLSTAGKRAGLRPGTRSGLWEHFAYAINQLRPSLVVIENVRGLLSASAHSDLEPCPWCVGDRPDGHLRALGAVLGDLAELGYDAAWVGLRAADVGAAHGRFRVFVVAYPHGEGCGGVGWLEPVGRDADGRRGADGPGATSESTARLIPRMLPTPTTRDHKDHTIRREPHRPDDVDTLARALTDVPCALLPTPAVNDMGEGKTVERWDEWTDDMRAKHGNGNGHGKSLAIEAQRLLPTPSTGESLTGHGRRGGKSGNGSQSGADLDAIAKADQWGDYAAAIARWETVLGRPAPAPTMTSAKGNPQLSPAFTEWMMGLPAGWITDVPGVTRNEALKLCGNGVVSQQAEAAVRWLLGVRAGVAA